MKTYKVPMKYVFTGEFEIKAESQEQANEFAIQHCGLVLGGDIHSTLPMKDVSWDFASHPEKKIGCEMEE